MADRFEVDVFDWRVRVGSWLVDFVDSDCLVEFWEGFGPGFDFDLKSPI